MLKRFKSVFAVLLAVTLLLPQGLGMLADTAAAASTVVLEQSFEDDQTGGWDLLPWGGSGNVAVSSDAASAGTKSLKLTNRSSRSSSLSKVLTGIMNSDRIYDISFKVRLGQGTDTFHLTAAVTSGGSTNYSWIIGDKAVADTAWTTYELKGYEVPSNTTAFRVYLESVTDSASTADVYLDEFMIVDVTPGETEEPGELDQSGVTADFEDGQGDWVRRFGAGGIEATNTDNHTAGGAMSLLTTAAGQYDGPLLNILGKMHKNHEYNLSVWVKMAPGQEQTRLRMSLQLGESSYANVSGNATVTDSQWVQLRGKVTMNTTPVILNAYVETADDDGGPRTFYIDDFSLTYAGALEEPLPIQDELYSLKDLYSDYFEIGAAVEPDRLSGTVSELLNKHFNSLVAENSMKPGSISPTESAFNISTPNTIAQYADNHDMKLRFHTLLWHAQGADWMLKDASGNWLEATEANKALVETRLKDYITRVVTQYKGVADYYDVVNEVIDEGRPDGMRDSYWYRITGTDFIKWAFEAAHAADPSAKLYINDYNTHSPRKRDILFNLVTSLRDEGVPIDGVGHQTHINISGPSIEQISESIQKFAEAGFDNQVTELDISVYTSNSTNYDPVPEAILLQQGYRFKELFKELVRLDEMGKHADPSTAAYNPEGWISNVTFWGIADDHSWLHRSEDNRFDAPFAFDKKYQAKLAYWGMVEAVKTLIPPVLPIVVKDGNAAQGTPVIDGATDLVWDTVTALSTEQSGTLQAQFKTLWDASNLYARVVVKDNTIRPGDQIELFVLDNNEIKQYIIPRTDTSVVEVSDGYMVEAAIPLTGTNEPGETVRFDVRVTDTLVNDGSEHGGNGAVVSWSDLSNMQNAYSEGYGALTLIEGSKVAQIQYGTPQIDGEMDSVWAYAEDLDTNVWVQGNNGSTATIKTLWDKQHLYVYAAVTDSLLSDQSPNAWEQDSVEIFVDQNNGKTQSYQSDDGQYRINFNNVKSFGGRANADNYQSAVKLVDGGYIIEAAIALDTITPKGGTIIGFDFQVNNDENGDGQRDSIAIWNDPTGQSYQNTSRLGVLQFMELPKPEVVQARALNHQVVKLNWSEADGAIGYNVYQSTTADGPFVKLTNQPITDVNYVINKLRPGTTYYYYITAMHPNGESDPTVPITATTKVK
ncbi:endo-1,4-beta-xylanase [Paenibacillus harenae]|uniref:Beta-xylanase n=1 Tax=Paenibacillus harenae TaxID=306543 RepID=A0ABT9TZ00_PAEHA|nr:endo-1,4-beta-xylanase [Paenibacillus harenae]MDQ0112597.1 endo-1,4-beta-xylanase [Paenibacillus harenae]